MDTPSKLVLSRNVLLLWYQLHEVNVQLILFKAPKYKFSRKTKHVGLSKRPMQPNMALGGRRLADKSTMSCMIWWWKIASCAGQFSTTNCWMRLWSANVSETQSVIVCQNQKEAKSFPRMTRGCTTHRMIMGLFPVWCVSFTLVRSCFKYLLMWCKLQKFSAFNVNK